MENNNLLDGGEMTQIQAKEFFKQVYAYMAMAMGISGAIAYTSFSSNFLNNYFSTPDGGVSPIFWVVMLAPVGLALLIQIAYNRLSFGVLTILFVAYSVLMGLVLSMILQKYTGVSVVSTFLITAGAFAGMAILGYTTKVDLSRMGSLLYMVFIGMFIAGIVNIWLGSSLLQYVISILGVFVFTGLIAYEMQNLKHIANESGMDSVTKQKLALIGGLKLYILFVNLFLTLIRLLGRRE
jgi:uncharacterized protein